MVGEKRIRFHKRSGVIHNILNCCSDGKHQNEEHADVLIIFKNVRLIARLKQFLIIGTKSLDAVKDVSGPKRNEED